MNNIVSALLKQGLSRKNIAKKLNTTEWQVRKITAELRKEKKELNPPKDLLEGIKHFKPSSKKVKTYIFTSWEIRTDPSEEFIDILKQMQTHYNAELVLVPVWPEDLKFIPPKLKEFKIVTSDFKINDNLFFKYVPTNALVVSPLTGWKGAFPESSAIIPGLIKEMVTEPSQRLAKQLMTTGSIGRLNPELTNYKHIEEASETDQREFHKRWGSVVNRRMGRVYAIAQEYTIPSALVVNVLDNKTFLSRFVSMPKTGTVYDMNLRFTAGKSNPEIYSPEALVMGDCHAWQMDTSAWNATIEMLNHLKPNSLVLNDFTDFISANHHEVDDAAVFFNAPTIEQEIFFTKEKLNEISCYAKKVYYLGSNHDDFIIKYLKNENNYKYNYNYSICLEIRAAQIRSNRHPIIKLLEMDKISNLEYIDDNANYQIAGVTVIHGHQTISGRRAGFRALAQVYNYVIMGHSHVPSVWRNASMVGTTSKLFMNYNKGVSGWLHCNGLIHNDGSTQLLTMINGRWK
ncbi:MAG TPA: hypothetical protein PLP33_14565 [Leptospiraceae bacterium]|nr:hypothetical protein [Leptospiraceae bacterium]